MVRMACTPGMGMLSLQKAALGDHYMQRAGWLCFHKYGPILQSHKDDSNRETNRTLQRIRLLQASQIGGSCLYKSA